MLQSLKFIAHWFAPTTDALLNPSLRWTFRWRLLALQPLALLTYALKYFPHLFSRRYSVIKIPTRGRHSLRAIVFRPPRETSAQPFPLHIDFHGGGFLGGLAEYDATFCELLSDRAGAVVISAQYRYAPVNVYPYAHEDAEDIIAWALKNAWELWNADAGSLTVSGSSAGGNLMFTAGRKAKAAVGFCAVVDLRIPPWQKPKPESFPKIDPLSWLAPLFDAYAGGSKELQRLRKGDPRLSPILKAREDLPGKILFINAGIDILFHEELSFIDRLCKESKANQDGDGQEDYRSVVFDKGFHGWLDLPAFATGAQGVRDRERAFSAAISFLMNAHKVG